MKRAALFFLILTVTLVGLLAWKGRSQENSLVEAERRPVKVKTQLAGDSHQVDFSVSVPGLIKSEKEVVVKSKAGGQVTWLNFELGSSVALGEVLLKVDDGGDLTVGKNNFSSNQIRQQELALKQAKESYDLAKENYRKDDTDANESAKKIAKLQYQGAQIALQSLLNDALLTAPLTGVVTEKLVSVGDTVTSGQAVATISQANDKKIQFFVEREMLSFIKLGDPMEVKIDENEDSLKAQIFSIAPGADPASKKFKIEAEFLDKELPFSGIIATAILKVNKKTLEPDNFLLPISVLTIGQNESFLFISEEERAKKVLVKVKEIIGEFVQIEASLGEDARIIVEGNKQVQAGSVVMDNN